MKIIGLGCTKAPIKRSLNSSKTNATNIETKQVLNDSLNTLAMYNKANISFGTIGTRFEPPYTPDSISILVCRVRDSIPIFVNKADEFNEFYKYYKKKTKTHADWKYSVGFADNFTFSIIENRVKLNGITTKASVVSGKNIFRLIRQNPEGTFDQVCADKGGLTRVTLGRNNPYDDKYDADEEFIFSDGHIVEYRKGLQLVGDTAFMEQRLILTPNPPAVSEFYKNYAVQANGEIFYDLLLKYNLDNQYDRVDCWMKPYKDEDAQKQPHKKHRNKFVKNLDLPPYNPYGSI